MMRRFLFAGTVIALLVMVGFVSWRAGRNNVPVPTQLTRDALSVTGQMAEEIVKDVSTPPPLIARRSSARAQLTRTGVVLWTNANRKKYELAPLLEVSLLDVIAEARLRDMFEKQYFDHVSPTGDSVAKVAARVGYEYLRIGENIALGNFEDDRTLVDAWMDSPGHRANILGTRYEELGVAVGQGTYEGQKTWIGVQVFALPTSACPSTDAALRLTVEADQARLDELGKSAQILKAELDVANPRTSAEVTAYNQKVDQYNVLANQVNALAATTRAKIAEYNAQVRAQNDCIGKQE